MKFELIEIPKKYKQIKRKIPTRRGIKQRGKTRPHSNNELIEDFDPKDDLPFDPMEEENRMFGEEVQIKINQDEFKKGNKILISGYHEQTSIVNELRFLLNVLPEKRRQILKLAKKLMYPYEKIFGSPKYERLIRTGQMRGILINKIMWRELLDLRREAMQKIGKKT